jgi:membrane protease YdiL (CAAX protease family)
VSRRGAPGPPDGREPRLAEFPLGPSEAEAPPRDAARAPGPAPLSLRGMAATADLAAVMLGVSLPIVAASALAGRWPTPRGLAWAALYAVAFSFGTTVAALFLFGRTPGMTLAGLVLQPDATGRRPTLGQAARRWLGTASSAAALGLPVLLAAGGGRPTPADRMSGRPLVEE